MKRIFSFATCTLILISYGVVLILNLFFAFIKNILLDLYRFVFKRRD